MSACLLVAKLSSRTASAAKSFQSCPTLCDPIDSSPPGTTVLGNLQARTLEWVASSFSNAWKWKVKVKSLSHVRLLATPWTAAYQAPPSMGFSRQEYWSGVLLPSPLSRKAPPKYHLERTWKTSGGEMFQANSRACAEAPKRSVHGRFQEQLGGQHSQAGCQGKL